MRHGDDFHSVPAQSVNQAEGKSWEDVPSGTASMTGPSKRIVGNSVDRVPELLAKAVRRRRVSRGVPVICRFRLLRCGRVEPDGGRSHSAPVQPHHDRIVDTGVQRIPRLLRRELRDTLQFFEGHVVKEPKLRFPPNRVRPLEPSGTGESLCIYLARQARQTFFSLGPDKIYERVVPGSWAIQEIGRVEDILR